MIQTSDLQAAELAALLHFYADAGVDTLLEDEGIDRFAEFERERQAAAVARPAPQQTSAPSGARARPSASPTSTPTAPPRPISQPVTIPGDEAIKLAREAASAASTIAELYDAVSGFEGCNLKFSARNTVFPKTASTLPITILGPAPSPEDDREGAAFSGAHGDLLQKMMAAIGIDTADVMLAHAIAWRPPGGRPPTQAEAEICRPFAERLLQLSKPKAVIMMGNFTARFFTGSSDPIHALRGQWFDLKFADFECRAIAMLHPQDLITAPISKRLAWADLQAFESTWRDA